MLLQSVELCCGLGVLLKTDWEPSRRLKWDGFTVEWCGTCKPIQPHAFQGEEAGAQSQVHVWYEPAPNAVLDLLWDAHRLNRYCLL